LPKSSSRSGAHFLKLGTRVLDLEATLLYEQPQYKLPATKFYTLSKISIPIKKYINF